MYVPYPILIGYTLSQQAVGVYSLSNETQSESESDLPNSE